MPTLYWCPHQVLKATGAPDAAVVFVKCTGMTIGNKMVSTFITYWEIHFIFPKNLNVFQPFFFQISTVLLFWCRIQERRAQGHSFDHWYPYQNRQGKTTSLLPCPKIFWASPRFFCWTKNLFTYWACLKHFCLFLLQVPKCFVPVQMFWAIPKIWLHLVTLQKLLCQYKNQFYWMQIIFRSGTKCLWLAQYVNKFLLRHKTF